MRHRRNINIVRVFQLGRNVNERQPIRFRPLHPRLIRRQGGNICLFHARVATFTHIQVRPTSRGTQFNGAGFNPRVIVRGDGRFIRGHENSDVYSVTRQWVHHYRHRTGFFNHRRRRRFFHLQALFRGLNVANGQGTYIIGSTFVRKTYSRHDGFAIRATVAHSHRHFRRVVPVFGHWLPHDSEFA